jgi:hypothetical protein
MDRLEAPQNPGEIIETLKRDGLVEKFDIEEIRQMCMPETLNTLSIWTHRDEMGENFSNYVIPSLSDSKYSLPVVFIGNAHIPAFAVKADSAGFRPLITTSVSRDNLDRNREFYQGLNKQDGQNGIGSILGAIEYYKFGSVRSKNIKPIVFVGDSHGLSYEICLPKIGTLQQIGVSKIQVFTEDEPNRDIDLEELRNGFEGKKQLAEVIEQYRKAGLLVTIKGIEGSRFANRQSGGLFYIGSDYSFLSHSTPVVVEKDNSGNKKGSFDENGWQQLAVERGLSKDDIEDPEEWLKEQIVMYSGMGKDFKTTIKRYRNALMILKKEK